MFKFGMKDYEVNQNIIGVLIGNIVIYGFIAGAVLTAAIAGLLILIF